MLLLILFSFTWLTLVFFFLFTHFFPSYIYFYVVLFGCVSCMFMLLLLLFFFKNFFYYSKRWQFVFHFKNVFNNSICHLFRCFANANNSSISSCICTKQNKTKKKIFYKTLKTKKKKKKMLRKQGKQKSINICCSIGNWCAICNNCYWQVVNKFYNNNNKILFVSYPSSVSFSI